MAGENDAIETTVHDVEIVTTDPDTKEQKRERITAAKRVVHTHRAWLLSELAKLKSRQKILRALHAHLEVMEEMAADPKADVERFARYDAQATHMRTEYEQAKATP